MSQYTREDASTYSQGAKTLRVSRKQLHQKIRSNLLTELKKVIPQDSAGVVVLQGGKETPFYSTDMDYLFRQESYFHYVFGVEEPGFYGAIDLNTDAATLFMPRLPQAYAVWFGVIHGPAFYQQKYAVDSVHYVDEMTSVLQQLKPCALHVLHGVNTDSGLSTLEASFDGIEHFKIEREHLFPVITECRVKKLPEEIEIIRYCNTIASEAHVEAMKACATSTMEYELESTFLHHCYKHGGCRHAPYTPIVAAASRGAVLHYGHAGAPNNGELAGMVVADMGCEYYRYGSDITCSYPSNGKFTDNQALIYNAVLAAQHAVKDAMRPGVPWPDMHLLAERTILTHLKEGGLLTGELDEMMRARMGAVFMPHGLGHLLGIDTHDVGGYPSWAPPRSDLPGLKSLRTARVLEAGMVITVEPGCYFNAAVLQPAMESADTKHFFVTDRIKDFVDFGGVRIEDNVVVTESGAESLTHVPRTVAEIESLMSG